MINIFNIWFDSYCIFKIDHRWLRNWSDGYLMFNMRTSPLGKSINEWLRDEEGKVMMGVGTDKNLSSQKKKTGPFCREQKKLCRIFQSCKGQNMDGVIISRETDLCVLKMHFFSSWTRLILTKALVAALLYNFHSFLWIM